MGSPLEAFLPEWAKVAMFCVVATFFVLVWMSRRYPDVGWLAPFRLPALQMTEAQKARHRRTSTIFIALQIMLLGAVLPVLYIMSKMFMFDEPTRLGFGLSMAAGAACIVAGIAILVRNR
jgi:sterol desaturase/sphingolipid hydroxylase (fatty acid hydroxylase superfamily)